MKIHFSSKDDCLEHSENKTQTNPRYKDFTQHFFTIGDNQQANEHLLNKVFSAQKYIAKKSKQKSDFTNTKLKKYDKDLLKLKFYKNFNNNSVKNTFKYLFENISTGIYVQIKSNKISEFIPFYNMHVKNYYKDYLKLHPKYNNNPIKMTKDRAYHNHRRFYADNTIMDRSKWIATNCFLYLEKGRKIQDTNYTQIYHMLSELIKKYKVPDCEFFINRKDTAVITKKLTEPYFHIFGEKTPLRRNKFNSYAPIFSYSAPSDNADILFPTPDDWEIVTKKIFPHSCRDTYLNNFVKVKWEDKKPTAFFRGGATGCGVHIFNNSRLKAAHLSHMWENDGNYNNNNKIDGIKFLDAGITAFNPRYKKYIDRKYIEFIKPNNLDFKKASFFPMIEQTKYKYILDIDGNVSAYRLGFILSSGSVILKVESIYNIWFSHLLEPWKHYVPVKSDLSDLDKQITWCKKNDAKCKKIADNAMKFADKYITKDFILEYLYFTLCELNKIQSSANII